jgi:cation diffusion facilitator family transporter
MSAPTASTRTIVIALLANVGIAISKFFAAAMTGSSAMLTEGVHSAVDSTNQLLLMWGRRQAKKPPDQLHPFGYGREVYFWSFVVAVLVFALGAGVSIYEGIIHLHYPHETVSPLVAYAVLFVAFGLDGWSTIEAYREFKAVKGKAGWIEAIRRSKDPAAFIVLLENAAAEAGVVTAAIGLFLAERTGNPFYDGAASIVIGLILGLTAFVLAYESKGLLIGEAADPEIVAGLATLIREKSGVVAAGEVRTVHSSPDQITAMVSVDFDDSISAADVENIVCTIEEEASVRWPEVQRLYIRPRKGSLLQGAAQRAAT